MSSKINLQTCEYARKSSIFQDNQLISDKYVITGHTPTQAIRNNPNPGYIYRRNNHIAIDCGATYPGGRLAAICLDTGEEYYSEPNKMGSDAIGL